MKFYKYKEIVLSVCIVILSFTCSAQKDYSKNDFKIALPKYQDATSGILLLLKADIDDYSSMGRGCSLYVDILDKNNNSLLKNRISTEVNMFAFISTEIFVPYSAFIDVSGNVNVTFKFSIENVKGSKIDDLHIEKLKLFIPENKNARLHGIKSAKVDLREQKSKAKTRGIEANVSITKDASYYESIVSTKRGDNYLSVGFIVKDENNRQVFNSFDSDIQENSAIAKFGFFDGSSVITEKTYISYTDLDLTPGRHKLAVNLVLGDGSGRKTIVDSLASSIVIIDQPELFLNILHLDNIESSPKDHGEVWDYWDAEGLPDLILKVYSGEQLVYLAGQYKNTLSLSGIDVSFKSLIGDDVEISLFDHDNFNPADFIGTYAFRLSGPGEKNVKNAIYDQVENLDASLTRIKFPQIILTDFSLKPNIKKEGVSGLEITIAYNCKLFGKENELLMNLAYANGETILDDKNNLVTGISIKRKDGKHLVNESNPNDSLKVFIPYVRLNEEQEIFVDFEWIKMGKLLLHSKLKGKLSIPELQDAIPVVTINENVSFKGVMGFQIEASMKVPPKYDGYITDKSEALSIVLVNDCAKNINGEVTNILVQDLGPITNSKIIFVPYFQFYKGDIKDICINSFIKIKSRKKDYVIGSNVTQKVLDIEAGMAFTIDSIRVKVKKPKKIPDMSVMIKHFEETELESKTVETKKNVMINKFSKGTTIIAYPDDSLLINMTSYNNNGTSDIFDNIVIKARVFDKDKKSLKIESEGKYLKELEIYYSE